MARERSGVIKTVKRNTKASTLKWKPKTICKRLTQQIKSMLNLSGLCARMGFWCVVSVCVGKYTNRFICTQLRGEEDAECEAVQKVARAEQTADRPQRESGGLFEELGDVLNRIDSERIIGYSTGGVCRGYV